MHDSQLKQIRKLTQTIDNKKDEKKNHPSKSIRGRGNQEEVNAQDRDDALSK